MVMQLQLAKRQEEVPLTRDYILEREAELRRREDGALGDTPRGGVGLGRLGEPNREARRRHALKLDSVDIVAFAAVYLELHVDDGVGPVVLSFPP